MSLAAARRWRKTELRKDFQTWWSQQPKPKHLPSQLMMSRPWDTSWIRDKPRTPLSRLLDARSGHGDYAKYHIDFQNGEAELLCRLCRELKEPLHHWHCKSNPTVKRRLNKRFIQQLLHSPKGAAYLLNHLDPVWNSQHIPRQPPHDT